jgi:predicted phage-related endonuclease
MAKILDLIQGSDEWVAARWRHNCASEAPVMMGASRHMQRNELLQMKATGSEKVFSDYVRKHILAKGHASEAGGRPITEEMIGQDLYPVTVTDDAEYLLASLDGQTMDGAIIFEHKEWSEALAAQVRAKDLDPHYYWQLEQELLAAEGQKVIFVTSDGTREKFEWMEYTAVPGRAERLMAGWKQFDLDVAAYEHVEVQPAPAAAAIEALPALMVTIEGKVLASNLEDFEKSATTFIAAINTDLTTDQHFADAAQTVKFCKDGEDRLELVKAQAIAQTASIEKLFATIDKISGQLRSKRLELDKLVTARKDTIRADIVRKGQTDFAAHITALNEQLGRPYMPSIVTDFAGAVKGKRELSSMRNAVATELARAKIEANEVCGRILKNLNFMRENAKDHAFLFNDTSTIVLKAEDDLQVLVKSRISEQAAAEAKRLADEREKIRKEEQDKAEKAVAAAATPAPTAAPVATPEPTYAPRAPSVPLTTGIVVPMGTRRPAAAPATPPTLKLGQIGERLGFSLTADFIKQLGFEPAAKEKSALLFHESSFDLICEALKAHITTVQAKQQQAA